MTPSAFVSVRRKVTATKALALRRVPQRFHAITDELAKFGIVGLINLVVNFAVFNLLWLTVLRSGEVKAKAVATIVATTCAYFLNRYWTYRDRPKSTLRREYTLFFLFNVVGLIIEVTVVGVAKYGFHLTHILVLNVCTAIGIALGTIFRFWAYRTHVFRVAESDGEPVTTEADPTAVEADLDRAEPDPVPDRAASVVTADDTTSQAATSTADAAAADPANGTHVNGGRVRLSPVNGTPVVGGTPAIGTSVNGARVNGARVNGASVNGGAPNLNDVDDEDRVLFGELVQLEFNDIVDRAAERPARRR